MPKEAEQMTLFGQDSCVGKMSQARSVREPNTARTSVSFSRKSAALQQADYLCLDLRAGGGNLLGPCWEKNSPLLGDWLTLKNVKLHIFELMESCK